MKITKRQLRQIIKEVRAEVPAGMTDAELDAEMAKDVPKDFGPRGISTVKMPELPEPRLPMGPYRMGDSWETGNSAWGRQFSAEHPLSLMYHPLQTYAQSVGVTKNSTGIRGYEVQPGGPGGKWVLTFIWYDRYGRRAAEKSTPIEYSENVRDTGDWNIWRGHDGLGAAITRHLVDLGAIPPERLDRVMGPSAQQSNESVIRISKSRLRRIIAEEKQKLKADHRISAKGKQ